MAQKSKTATKRSSRVLGKVKPIEKSSKVKKASGGKLGKAKASAGISATKAMAKKSVAAKNGITTAKGAEKGPTVKASEPRIEQAKAALKKVSDSKPDLSESRPTPKVRARKFSVDIDPNEATSALAQKWSSLYKKAEQIESKAYNMRSVFEEKTAIVHKVLGWGYILANRNDRLEVLFKDGIKYLISNYKP